MTRRKTNGATDYLLMAAVFAGVLLVAKTVLAKRTETPAGALPPASAPPSQAGPLTLQGAKVLLIGSSSAVGVGPRLEKMLKQHGIADFKNLGVVSTTIGGWSDNDHPEGKAFEAAMASYQPNVVFIILGTNEEAWRKNRPTWDVTAQRKTAVERMRRKLGSVRSIYLGMPPHHLWPMDRKYRDFLQTTWGEDFFRTEDVAPEKSGDGIHLSGKGYEQWVAAIDAWLKAKGA